MPFEVWAPDATEVRLLLADREVGMEAVGDGWFSADVPATPGTDYSYLLDSDGPCPDPRSRMQPHGIDPPSRVPESLHGSRGNLAIPSLGDWVLYELHIGTFSPQGTFAAAAERLDHLAALGVNAVELMPINTFSGVHGWGYDGVGLYAPHCAYGTREELASLVESCHSRGMAVVLDVVYNHLGPRGNNLRRFGPYFTDLYRTPWGDAINFDGRGSDEVRSFFIDNAEMWLTEFGFDALRIDAVHAILDRSATHFLEELAVRIGSLAASTGRELYLIAESDLNDPRLLRDRREGGFGLHAQWSDDLHHAIHASLTGESQGYYADFGSLGDVAAALSGGYVYTGQRSSYRGRRHGRAPTGLPGTSFVTYLQNHDQVGNRAGGERIGSICGGDLQKVGAALVLTSPFVPLIFMGEEWAASSPFQYFTSHPDAGLGRAVSAGRRREFEAFGWDPRAVPDPQDPATFERSKLDWDEIDAEEHTEMLEWYRALLALRRTEPSLGAGPLDQVEVRSDEDERWLAVTRGDVTTAVNLSDEPSRLQISGQVLLASKDPGAAGGTLELQARSAVIVKTDRA